MNLNAKGKLARFYMWLPPEGGRLPRDLCTFFWGLVARAFVVFGLGGMLLGAVLHGVAQAGLFLWAHKGGTLLTAALIAFSALAVWFSERKKKIGLFSEARQVVRAKIEGVKGRYCPRIDWE